MRFAYQLILLLLITVTSCSKEDEIDPQELQDCILNVVLDSGDEEYNRYLKNKTLWDCQGVKTYSFINVNKGENCFNTEHLLNIEDNVIVDTQLINVNFSDDFCFFYSIDEIYLIIEAALDPDIEIFISESRMADVADIIEIEYDTIIGIPTKLYIDYLVGRADEEFEFELREFEI